MWLQLGHKIRDIFDRQDEQHIRKAVAELVPNGMERRQFLKYLGVGAAAVIFPKIIPTQKSLHFYTVDVETTSLGAWFDSTSWNELGRTLSVEIYNTLSREGFTRKVLVPNRLSDAEMEFFKKSGAVFS